MNLKLLIMISINNKVFSDVWEKAKCTRQRGERRVG